MISNLWSATKVGYDKDAAFGIKHWDPKLQQFFKAQLNRFSKHNVYSIQKILSVVSVKINKLHGYGHLEEIVVRKDDQQLYKFKEGDFVNLHLNNIEDMLLLVAQHKLFNLEGSDIIDLVVALHGTLKLVRDKLQHRALNFRLGYNKEMSRRKWSAVDKRRSKVMVKLIDKQMRERWIIRNLERLVGAWELEMDYSQNQRDLPRDIPLNRIEVLSLIRLFLKGKKHGRMMLDSIDNGPLVYLTAEENGQTRPKKYSKLIEAQQLQDDCDAQETNIILHSLLPDVLYNLFDKFAYVQEWSKFVTDVKLAKSLYTTNYDQLYAYHSQHKRHANEVRIMLERYSDPLAFVANSPTLYNLSQSPQHSGSLMYPPPQQFTPVYAALIHHQHYHTQVNPQQHPVSPPLFISPLVTQQSQAEFPQLDSSLAVPMFQQGEYPIECINKAMAFLSVVASRFPPSNNQLRTSSNPRNQAAI
ncbi:hypothetical protein Tco_0072275 [Tanacetum coccineum]